MGLASINKIMIKVDINCTNILQLSLAKPSILLCSIIINYELSGKAYTFVKTCTPFIQT